MHFLFLRFIEVKLQILPFCFIEAKEQNKLELVFGYYTDMRIKNGSSILGTSQPGLSRTPLVLTPFSSVKIVLQVQTILLFIKHWILVSFLVSLWVRMILHQTGTAYRIINSPILPSNFLLNISKQLVILYILGHQNLQEQSSFGSQVGRLPISRGPVAIFWFVIFEYRHLRNIRLLRLSTMNQAILGCLQQEIIGRRNFWGIWRVERALHLSVSKQISMDLAT